MKRNFCILPISEQLSAKQLAAVLRLRCKRPFSFSETESETYLKPKPHNRRRVHFALKSKLGVLEHASVIKKILNVRVLNRSQCGVAGLAIILITMIVSLATLVVVNLTHSTFLAGRSVGMVERQLQAEYALKSVINLAGAILATDQSPRVDAKQDVWGIFLQGAPVPPEILATLGFNTEGMQVYLEITPENSKLRIDQLDIRTPLSQSGKDHDEKWKKIYTALFQELGFDDQVLEPDHTGLFPKQEFKSAELVENLATYQLTDLPEGSTKLPTGNGKITRIGDLSNIPGFTPRRLSLLTPYITTYGNALVNVNVALPRVLKALDPELDPNLIVQYREGTPIENISQLQEILPPEVAQKLTGRVSTESDWFQVICKIEFGGGITYFAKAIISTSEGIQASSKVESLQIF